MSDRGKPRKVKCPENKSAKSKTTPGEVSLPRYVGEEQHTSKEQELKECEKKKANHTMKTSVQSTQKEATTKKGKMKDKSAAQSVGETTKMQPEDTTKHSPNSTKAKQCGRKTKSPEQFSAEMQPETPKDTSKASLKITKAKTCGDNPKSPLESPQERTRTQSRTQKDTTNESIGITKEKTYKASIRSTKAKTGAGKVRSPEQLTEDSVNVQPETPKYTNICGVQHRCKDDRAVDTILYTTLEKLKIRKNDRANAAEVINDIKKHIFKYLKENTQSFKDVEEPLCTGSYYENVKVSAAPS